MNHRQTLSGRIVPLILLISLLLPILSTPGFTLLIPQQEEPELPISIWNGGVAEGFLGAGTESDPYLISTPEELALLAQNVRTGKTYSGSYFRLAADLYLNDIQSYDQWKDRSPARRWTPIGGYAPISIQSAEEFDSAMTEWSGLYLRTQEGYQEARTFQSGVVYYRLTAFSGVFNGDGHTVFGLYVQEDEEYSGLFGACTNAVVKNLMLDSAYVMGEQAVGALAGALIADGNLTIDQCQVNGIVQGNRHVGGLIGSTLSTDSGKITIHASSFRGNVNGTSQVGGILGTTLNGSGSITLANCESFGRITASEAGGGILGSLCSANDWILSCYNRGPVLCQQNGGGIVGLIAPQSGIATISSCRNHGTLLGDSGQGGIIGKALIRGASTIELLSCRNLGDIHGAQGLGGIIGSAELTDADSSLQVSGNKNSAPISGNASVGGIIGLALVKNGSLTTAACENYGSISALQSAGGILGRGQIFAHLHIYQCSVRASVTATESISGGIVGQLSSLDGSIRVELSATAGTIKAPKAVGGIVGEAISGANRSSVDSPTEESTVPSAKTDTPDSSAQSAALIEIHNCLSAATLSSQESAGGIVGLLTANAGKSEIASSLFCGMISTGCKVTGGIAAIAHAAHKDATAQVIHCYYNSNSSARAMLAKGGEGNETCITTAALSEEALRKQTNLTNLDFANTWQESPYYPTLQKVPFVWEEYTYTVTQNGAILLAYTGRSDIALIPEKLGGIAVTTISESAFSSQEIIRVILPDTITAIGEAAFADCSDLEQVTLSASLVSIGARAFANCSSLRELRCNKSLSTLQVGSDNESFQALSLTQPITILISHSYESGSSAGKSTTLTAYPGDYYQIKPLEINGYEADDALLSGICDGTNRISVIYRLGTYHLTIRYLLPDGSEAFAPYEGDFQFGEQYSIPTPSLDGYTADRALLEGVMDGKDVQFTVVFTEVFSGEERQTGSMWEIALLILSILVMVCCIVYFIHRYRVITDLSREAPKPSKFS